MDHMDMKNGSMGGMHMTFYFGNSATILFDSWKVSTWQGMLWSCVVVLIASFVYEGLKSLRQHLVQIGKAQHSSPRSTADDDDNILLVTPRRWKINRNRIILHLVQTGLHLIQLTMGYMLMLVAMTFNAWLFISLVLGATVGYLLFNFRQMFAEDIHDPCH